MTQGNKPIISDEALQSFTSKKLDLLDGMSADPRLSGTDFRVAYRLIQHVNATTGACFPSQESIADEIGIKPRTVRDSIANLKLTGWLKSTARSSSGRGKSNFYRFNGKNVNAMLDRILMLREARDELRKNKAIGSDQRHINDGETLTTGTYMTGPSGTYMTPNTLKEHPQVSQVKRGKHQQEEIINSYSLAKEGKVA